MTQGPTQRSVTPQEVCKTSGRDSREQRAVECRVRGRDAVEERPCPERAGRHQRPRPPSPTTAATQRRAHPATEPCKPSTAAGGDWRGARLPEQSAGASSCRLQKGATSRGPEGDAPSPAAPSPHVATHLGWLSDALGEVFEDVGCQRGVGAGVHPDFTRTGRTASLAFLWAVGSDFSQVESVRLAWIIGWTGAPQGPAPPQTHVCALRREHAALFLLPPRCIHMRVAAGAPPVVSALG